MSATLLKHTKGACAYDEHGVVSSDDESDAGKGGGTGGGDVHLDVASRDACVALLSSLAAAMHRSDARGAAQEAARERAAAREARETIKRARVRQDGSRLAVSILATSGDALTGILSFLDARGLASAACVRALARADINEDGEGEGDDEGDKRKKRKKANA